jgi:hypothetical protein
MQEKSYKYSPREPEEIDDLIAGSYGRFIQLERRNLLVVSFVTVFSALTNINPSKGALFGLSFENFNVSSYYTTLLILAVYFLSAFIIYGYPNYRIATRTKGEILKKGMTITRTVNLFHVEWSRLMLDFKYKSWVFIHYLLPVMFGCVSIIVCIIKII